MTITTAQIRGARGLLDWSQAELSRRTGISTTSIGNIESGHTQARESTLNIIRESFEESGIEFIEEGVRQKNDKVTVFEKKNDSDNPYLRLMDDIYYTLKDSGGQVLFSFVDNSLSPKEVLERQQAIRGNGIQMRFLVRNNDTNLAYPLSEYRYLPEGFYQNSPTIMYGNKVGCLLDNGRKVIIIKDAAFSEVCKLQFEIIWSYGAAPTQSKTKETA